MRRVQVWIRRDLIWPWLPARLRATVNVAMGRPTIYGVTLLPCKEGEFLRLPPQLGALVCRSRMIGKLDE